MNYIISHSSMVQIYEQLTSQIKAAVASGTLEPGAMLPSVRSLAADLQISALTVKKAYDRLEESGVLVTVHGKGSFIAETSAGFMEESRRVEAEKALSDAIDRLKAAGYGKDQIRELAELILEEQV